MTDKLRQILENIKYDTRRLEDMLTYESYVNQLEGDYKKLYELAVRLYTRLDEVDDRNEDWGQELRELERLFEE